MARGEEALDLYIAELDRIAVVHPIGRTVGPGQLVHREWRLSVIAQRHTTRDMVGMGVSIDDKRQAPFLLLEHFQIILDAIQHRIDECCFPRLLRTHQIGATGAWVHLSKDHGYSPSSAVRNSKLSSEDYSNGIPHFKLPGRMHGDILDHGHRTLNQ